MFFNQNLLLTLSPDEVLVYLRKSRSDDPTLSVEEVLAKHETILNEWAEKNLGAKVPEENKYREVVSGETIADRPEIQKVLTRVESPRIKAILTVEVQRLSRGDLEDAGRLMKLLRYTNTIVITPQFTYNLADEYNRDIFERELKRGNEFLEYQKKIMNRGRLLSVSQGNYIASHPPYGYDRTVVMEGKKKCPTLKINEEQANVVRMVFDMYVNQDMGRINICHKLDALGVKPLHSEYWSNSYLKDMLQNIHYIGKVCWNKRKTTPVVEDGEIIKKTPRSKEGEYLIYEGKHPAIISEELFYAAQEKIGRNHRAKSTTKIRNPLATLLYCQCGKAMTLRQYKNSDGSERCAPRLACSHQVHCHTGSCLYDEMIELVCVVLKENIEDFKVKAKADDTEAVKLHEVLIKTLENKLQALNAKELAQWDAQADPDPANRMPAEIFRQLNEKLQAEKAEVQQALENAYTTMPTPVDYEEKILKLSDALNALKEPDTEVAVKNRLLKACIERITYNREKPELIRRQKGEKKGSTLKVGANWSDTPITIDVKLKV